MYKDLHPPVEVPVAGATAGWMVGAGSSPKHPRTRRLMLRPQARSPRRGRLGRCARGAGAGEALLAAVSASAAAREWREPMVELGAAGEASQRVEEIANTTQFWFRTRKLSFIHQWTLWVSGGKFLVP